MFDDAVSAGVSAEFCAAPSDMAGRQRREPFEIGFRWARAAPSELAARIVPFPPDSGALIRAASEGMLTSRNSRVELNAPPEGLTIDPPSQHEPDRPEPEDDRAR